jgi:hypothetical protein
MHPPRDLNLDRLPIGDDGEDRHGSWRLGRVEIVTNPIPIVSDRNTQNMPFSTRRSSTLGIPLGLFGRIGWMKRHSASVRA